MFKRTDYYSQTELCRELKVSPKKLKKLIKANQIPVLQRPIEIGYDRGDNFNVTGLYIKKSDWHDALK